MNNLARKYIIVEGIVQGVGFRPFIYNIAVKNQLKGWVKNTSEGVYIDIEGKEKDINKLLEELKNNPPPLSQIEKITVTKKDIGQFNTFTIKNSKGVEKPMTQISPDIATCKECEEEIIDTNNRRFKYPFTNCTNCGPRYSIIKELPYDRVMTTMADFKMCSKCLEEYKNPSNRRFHAQPNACSKCGPKIWLENSKGKKIESIQPIEDTLRFIKEGRILAIKGLGGFHLVCNGKDEKAVEKLRVRKSRPKKPFAVMMKNLEIVKKYCDVNKEEEEILTGIRKPILLLHRKNELLSQSIAPNNREIGVMLPYTPLHYQLFDKDIEILIMTSGNISGLPIEYKNHHAREKLSKVVDYYLMHNREIHLSVDDSVARVILDNKQLIRRSRGYAPTPFKLNANLEILACGSNLKNTISIAKNGNGFLSQYIGDLDNLETYNNYIKTIEHFKGIYKIEPKVIVHDMHPEFASSHIIQRLEGEKIAVQHHHAHIASCMKENKIVDKVIGIAFDGTGYGDDGKIWGGEFLVCDYSGYERAGHLNYVKMPGKDYAVKEPWRMSISHLYELYGKKISTNKFDYLDKRTKKNIITMISNNLNCIETSSMGRFFDAISALLGFNGNVSFEGEAAIRLENLINAKEKLYETKSYNYLIENVEGRYVINTKGIIEEILYDTENNVSNSVISKKFHNTVVAFSIDMCKQIRKKYRLNKVTLSGGVFQNKIIIEGIYDGLLKEDFQVFIHREIPCNDGGISFGQMAIAESKLSTRRK